MSMAFYVYCKTMVLSDGRFPAIIRLMKGIGGREEIGFGKQSKEIIRL